MLGPRERRRSKKIASHLSITIAVTTRATPAIYQSYLRWAKLPRTRSISFAYVHEHFKTHSTKQSHATIDVRSRNRTNPRSTRFVSGNVREYRRRSRRCQVDQLSRGRDVAHGVLPSSPKPDETIFFAAEEGYFVVCFLPTSRRYTFDLYTESTHGQPASCRARPVNIYDDLQSSVWIFGLGGERLPGVCPTFFA